VSEHDRAEPPFGAREAPEGVAHQALVERLALALLASDAVSVRRLLEEPDAAALPRDVREEALLFLRLPAGHTRAPIQTLRYRYILEQLARWGAGARRARESVGAGGEHAPGSRPWGAQTELPFSPPLPPPLDALAPPLAPLEYDVIRALLDDPLDDEEGR
jgi:hypothetical protein